MAVGVDSREGRKSGLVFGKLNTVRRDHQEREGRRRRSINDESVAKKESPRRSMRHRKGEFLSHADEEKKVRGRSVNGDPAAKTALRERGGWRSSSVNGESVTGKDDSLSYADEKKKERMRSGSEDPAAVGRRQVKRRHDIRIDPHDISNKRVVDGISPPPPTPPRPDSTVKKEVELSRNAQFRAIKPSPSILAFVEENLLGRRRSFELKKAGYNIDLSAPLDNIPFSTAARRERIEESVFRSKLEFFAAAKVSTSFPPPNLTEVAFAGRSNVGKSSLLNALTRQWGVVRTSDKPGLTQTINFFKLASKLCVVDLPGYGFAYAKEEVKEKWQELVKEYVSNRGLQRVCLLIDTKWGMMLKDREFIDLMERSRTPYQIVLTKTDLVFPIDVARRAMQIEEELKAKKSMVQPVMMVSSKSGAGIRSLRSMLSKMARFIKP